MTILILLIRKTGMKKLSKRFVYGSWIVIPIFMVLVAFVKIPIPEQIAKFSAEIEDRVVEIHALAEGNETELEKDDFGKDELQSAPQSGEENRQEEVLEKSEEGKGNAIRIWSVVKVIGVAGYALCVVLIVAYIVSTNVRFEHRCRHSRVYLCATKNFKLPVYEMDGIATPFLLWATIYVPPGMTEEELRYAMIHEEGHFRHGDGFWVMIRYLIFAFFFFNPIIWLAHLYSGYDCELACDEFVMRNIDNKDYRNYGSCLLDVIKKSKKVSERVLLSTNMKSEKRLIRARIENIAMRQQHKIGVMFVAVFLLLIASGCALMSKNVKTESEPTSEIASENLSEEVEEKSEKKPFEYVDPTADDILRDGGGFGVVRCYINENPDGSAEGRFGDVTFQIPKEWKGRYTSFVSQDSLWFYLIDSWEPECGWCYVLCGFERSESEDEIFWGTKIGETDEYVYSFFAKEDYPPPGESELYLEYLDMGELAWQIGNSAVIEGDDSKGQTQDEDFIFSMSSKQVISDESIEKLTLEELKIARNEIYARHGLIFHDEELYDYFISFDWYVPFIDSEDFDESMLSETEQTNIQKIRNREEELGVIPEWNK